MLSKVAMSLAVAGMALVPLLWGAPAHAQANRTWVSGVGDDVAPLRRAERKHGLVQRRAGSGERANILRLHTFDDPLAKEVVLPRTRFDRLPPLVRDLRCGLE